MEINGQLPPQLTQTNVQPSISSWRIGQILQTLVLQQISPTMAVLQINNQRVQADTTIPLTAGLRFETEVSRLGEKPLLTVRSILATETAVNTAIRQSLPLQTSISALLTNIISLSNQQATLALLSPAIQSLIKQIFNKLPNSEKINNSKIAKQFIKDSGIFFENKLSQSGKQSSATLISSDMKGLLLKLMAAIKRDPGLSKTSITAPIASSKTPLTGISARPNPIMVPAPPLRGASPQAQAAQTATTANMQNIQLILNELIKQTDGAVARTQLHQLASISGSEQSPTQISFELPVRNQEQVNIFHFSIEEDQHNTSEEEQNEKSWSVTVAFDLEPLGPMYARLKLQHEKIETTFWAENQETSLLVNQHLTELDSRYQKSGIESGNLQCFHGKPPEPVNTDIPQIFLDVKA